MKVPFLVLSYGEFAQTKKLFSIEENGIHMLPIFTNANNALKYSQWMNDVLKKLNDNRTLYLQVCNDQLKALDMFETIVAYCPDLYKVIIDPLPSDDQPTYNTHDVDDVLLNLQTLSTDVKSTSKTP